MMIDDIFQTRNFAGKMSENVPDLRKTLLKYKRSINDDNIDIIVECIINGYIKINGIKLNIPVEILKILCQYYGNIFESNIITKLNDLSSFMDLISKKLKVKNIRFQKLYDANMDGFSVNTFHLKCDNKGPTLCIIKNEKDYIFGGYTKISWNNPKSYKYEEDKNAFLYNFHPNYRVFPVKLKGSDHAVRHSCQYGLSFGNGSDLIIYDNSNINGGSNSVPRAYQFKSYQITGIQSFKVKQIEVFKVIKEVF